MTTVSNSFLQESENETEISGLKYKAKQCIGNQDWGQGRSDGTPPFHPLDNPMCPTYAGSISQSEKRFSGGLVRTTLSHSLHI